MKEIKINIEALKLAAKISKAKRKTHKHPNWTDAIPLTIYNEGGKDKLMFMKVYEDGTFDIKSGDEA